MSEWRAIPGFPDYEVNQAGEVHRVTLGQGTRGGLLRQWRMKKGGYPAVTLMTPGGQRRSKAVHSLVMLAFVGPRPEGMEVCHRDGNAAHAHLDNLYYGTRSDNVRDAMEHGTWFNVGKHGGRWAA